MKRFILFIALAVSYEGMAQSVADSVRTIDNMPVKRDLGNAISIPKDTNRGNAIAMPTWSGSKRNTDYADITFLLNLPNLKKWLRPDSSNYRYVPKLK